MQPIELPRCKSCGWVLFPSLGMGGLMNSYCNNPECANSITMTSPPTTTQGESQAVTLESIQAAMKQADKITNDYLKEIAGIWGNSGYPVILNEDQTDDVVLMVNRRVWDELQKLPVKS